MVAPWAAVYAEPSTVKGEYHIVEKLDFNLVYWRGGRPTERCTIGILFVVT